MERLLVQFRDRPVGTLEQSAAGEWSFEYAAHWRGSPEGFPVSLSLPFDGPSSSAAAHAFFANLLPEGEARQSVCRQLGISEANDFALLAAIGGECAGALSIAPSSGPTQRSRGGYRELTQADLAGLAARGGALADVMTGARVRLSLAGAQDKLPVRVDGDRILLPLGSSASTHILKFESHRFKHLPANEVLLSLVASEAGLPVAPARLLRFSRRSAALVARYDRKVLSDGTVEKTHQEDLCQARGLLPGAKYEKEGGPSFAQCFGTVTAHVRDPLTDGRLLLQWLAFDVLTFNSDAHAKNVSLLYDGPVPRLAPFYDLLCTRAYPHLDHSLAMSVGGEDDPTLVSRRHWERLAEQTGLKGSMVADSVRQLADGLPDALARARARFRREYGESPALEMVVPKIRRQIRRIARQLGE